MTKLQLTFQGHRIVQAELFPVAGTPRLSVFAAAPSTGAR